MKNIFLLFVCFSFVVVNAQMNSGIIEYKVTSPDFDTNKKGQSQKTKEILGGVSKYYKYLSFYLDFNTKESLFKLESTPLFEGKGKFHMKSAIILTGGREIIYTNFSEDKKLNKKNFLGKNFLVNGKFIQIDWTITQETKKIGEYTCYKAIFFEENNPLFSKPRTITAWFTLDIPVPFGPKGYGGLPGLILELKEGRYTFYASNIRLSKEVKEITKPSGGEAITEEAYIALILEDAKRFERNKKTN